jgi:uncharacterized lipoprotein
MTTTTQRHTFIKTNTTITMAMAALILASSLSGCSSIKNMFNTEIDYKASKLEPKLEVPPDLTQLRTSPRYAASSVISTANAAAEQAAAQIKTAPAPAVDTTNK